MSSSKSARRRRRQTQSQREKSKGVIESAEEPRRAAAQEKKQVGRGRLVLSALGLVPLGLVLFALSMLFQDLRDERDHARTEARRTSAVLRELLDENKELRPFARLLLNLGGDLRAFRRFTIETKKGATYPVKYCDGVPCLVLVVQEVFDRADPPFFTVTLTRPELAGKLAKVGFMLRTTPGFVLPLRSKQADYTFLVEREEVGKVHVAVAESPGTGTGESFTAGNVLLPQLE